MASSITEDLVRRAAAGERPAMDELFTRLHDEVKKIVLRLMRPGRPGVDATDIVHRVYERLVKQRDPKWKDRTHFLRFVVLLARRAIADLPRPRQGTTLVSTVAAADGRGVSFAEFDECLKRLEQRGRAGPRMAEVVLLRCLTDLKWAEIAECLQMSERAVKGDWSFGKAFLQAELGLLG